MPPKPEPANLGLHDHKRLAAAWCRCSVFDLVGGSNIAGANVIVGGKGGQADILPAGSYATIGLGGGKEPGSVTVNKEYGLAFHPDSGMLAGMNSVTKATTRANCEGVLFCAQSNDDTGSNPHSPLYWLAKAGLSGSLVSFSWLQRQPLRR